MIQNDLQSWMVLVLVLISALYASYRLAPKASRALEKRAVLWLLKPGRSPWLARLGKRLAPRHRAGAASMACGSACSGCTPDDRTASI